MKLSQPIPVAVRKAAILVATLDPDEADAILDKMPEAFAARVRQYSVEIDDFTREEQEEVIREFVRAGGGPSPSADEGVELELSSTAPASDRRHDSDSPTTGHSLPPFGFLRDARSEVLAKHLAPQHPQVIAVVVAHLPPPQAADLVKRFSSKLQADVLRRVADLDLTDEEALRDVERELESLLRDELRMARNRQVGLANVQTILASAGRDRSRLYKSLSQHHRDLAEQLEPSDGAEEPEPVSKGRSLRPNAERSRPVHDARDLRREETAPAPMPHEKPARPHPSPRDFEELASLSDEGWAALIRAAEPQLILLALTGASEHLIKRMTQRLSKQEAQSLRQRLQHSGPLRLSDIELAQQELASLASRLAEQGALQLPQRRGFAAAA